jgi:hypothetical protein
MNLLKDKISGLFKSTNTEDSKNDKKKKFQPNIGADNFAKEQSQLKSPFSFDEDAYSSDHGSFLDPSNPEHQEVLNDLDLFFEEHYSVQNRGSKNTQNAKNGQK